MDDLIEEFVSVSGTDRRTARFFLERQRNDVNNALEDYFSHPDFTIPADYMREQTSNNDNEHRVISDTSDSSDYDYTASENSNDSSNQNDRDRNNPPAPTNSNNNDVETNTQQTNTIDMPVQVSIPTIEIDSSAIISTEASNAIEKEENYFNNDISPFPKQKSKGKSAKIYIYSNGILLFEKFYNKSSSNQYAQIMKSLQCGFLPSDLSPKNYVDIEICDLRSQEYSK